MITVAQVAQASDIELLCITYDIFLENVQQAQETADDKYIKKAREVLLILIENLDLSVPISQDLFDLYIYVQKLLISKKELPAVHRIISKIKEGYQTLIEQGIHVEEKMLTNTQNVYAGMTYGRSNLDEIVLEDNNRGFRI
ncbi:MAG: hypothetical protein BEN19_06965 [Epulopiscium sp. Nuni2H_MBin003]|nr:MAG: hypothetical protein BEN19_06965 [Epulopiscium sp. Nuni2H_MBin003]